MHLHVILCIFTVFSSLQETERNGDLGTNGIWLIYHLPLYYHIIIYRRTASSNTGWVRSCWQSGYGRLHGRDVLCLCNCFHGAYTGFVKLLSNEISCHIIQHQKKPFTDENKLPNLYLQVENDLKKYISYHHWDKRLGTNERLQLIAITQDMETEPIGLSCCFFTITRNFMSSVSIQIMNEII